MTKATIQSVRQTEKAGMFTICFEGDSFVLSASVRQRANCRKRRP